MLKIVNTPSKPKNKQEFSKKLIGGLCVFFLLNFQAVLIFCLVLIWHAKDTSVIPSLLVGFFSLMTAILTPSISFYFWKSKNENALKIKGQYIKMQKANGIQPTLDTSLVSDDTQDPNFAGSTQMYNTYTNYNTVDNTTDFVCDESDGF